MVYSSTDLTGPHADVCMRRVPYLPCLRARVLQDKIGEAANMEADMDMDVAMDAEEGEAPEPVQVKRCVEPFVIQFVYLWTGMDVAVDG